MKMVNDRFARTLEDLSKFDFEIGYVLGKNNQAADAFSRRFQTPDPQNYIVSSGKLLKSLRSVFKLEGGRNSLIDCLDHGLKVIMG